MYLLLNYFVVGSSSEGGHDNPFRPDGDISKEADEIVQRIKSGQPLLNDRGTPASPHSPPPPHDSPHHSPVDVADHVTSTGATQLQSEFVACIVLTKL